MTIRRDSVLIAVLLLACALIVLLSVQNRRLREDHRALADAGLKPQVGSWVPASPAATIDGRRLLLGQAARDYQVLYFFDPTCAQCEATSPAVRALGHALADGRHAGVDLVAVGTGLGSVLPAYARRHRFDFPVAYSTGKLRALFNISLVPLLVVVDRDGRVVHSHVGRFGTREEVASLMSALQAQGRAAVDATPRQGATP